MAQASGSSPSSYSPLGIDQDPSSLFAQSGPPGCASRSSSFGGRPRYIKMPALRFDMPGTLNAKRPPRIKSGGRPFALVANYSEHNGEPTIGRGARFRKRILDEGSGKPVRTPVLGKPGDDLLSRVLRRSTIGAGAFHGRVRDGIGCSRSANITRPAKDGCQIWSQHASSFVALRDEDGH